jgi:hypothetical protein
MQKHLSPGEYVTQEGFVLTVAQLDPLNVEAFLPLALITKLRVGMTAQVIPEPAVGGTYQAQLTILDVVADAASGTVGVRLTLANPEHKLPAGIKCDLVFPPFVAK